MEAMRPEEVQTFVAHSRLGHLGLAHGGRSYVIPIFYGFDGRRFYFQTNPGAKDAYIQGTEEACLTIVHAVTEDVWTSVMVLGRLEPVAGEPERLVAMNAMARLPFPPEWGFSKLGEPLREGARARLWKLVPRQMTGRKSVRPPPEGK